MILSTLKKMKFMRTRLRLFWLMVWQAPVLHGMMILKKVNSAFMLKLMVSRTELIIMQEVHMEEEVEEVEVMIHQQVMILYLYQQNQVGEEVKM